MGYRWLDYRLKDNDGYELTSLAEDDLLAVRIWRNAQPQVLRNPKPLTIEDQHRYWHEVVAPSLVAESPKVVLVAIRIAGALIGYGGLTNLDWVVRRAEVSFLVSPERAADFGGYVVDFRRFLDLLSELAFERMGLSRLFTETYDLRPHHVAVLEAAGYQLEGRLRRHQSVEGVAVDVLFHGLLREDKRVQ